ncbi:hypothetical protein NDU88_005270 [Pleurodeles waltl]|uniref:Uncharacterized protein n=1 Tax=Pleurodeles waltl TaxID=8319 RepID=A0AAV7WXE8_PLEWA|nr:hypothetical protein NDU88_005270 [Pleurodeles waltl]
MKAQRLHVRAVRHLCHFSLYFRPFGRAMGLSHTDTVARYRAGVSQRSPVVGPAPSALALLRQASRMDLVREEALAPGRPARRALAGVAVAVAACSPPRAGAGLQVRGVGRGASGTVLKGVVGAGKGRAGRRTQEFRGLPSGRGALRLRAGAVERRTALGKARRELQCRVVRPWGLAPVNGGDKWQSRA